MGREMVIVWAGRRQQDAWQGLCDDYRQRISRWAVVREVAVRARGQATGDRRLVEEGRALLEALPDPCWLVTLDRRGKAQDSPQLARWLRGRIEEWPHSIAFAIGSDLGLSPEVRDASRDSLSLGPLTLPHQLARLVLYEQLYRALSIAAGIKYHRGPL